MKIISLIAMNMKYSIENKKTVTDDSLSELLEGHQNAN